jgi:hypothetical protein
MAYAVGDTILDDEYIAFASSSSLPYGYNHFAGTGSGEYGLGQTALGLVSAGDTVQAAQWNSLFTAMNNIANHTNIALTSTTAVQAGDVVAIKSALITDLASLASAVAGGSTGATTGLTDSGATNKDTGTITKGTSATVTATVSLGSEDACRHFFNAGGKIKVSFSRTGSGGAGKNTEWDDICSRMGTIVFAAQGTSRSGGSSTNTTITTSRTFYNLTDTLQTTATATADTGVYNSDAITLQFRRTGFAGANGGNGTGVIVSATCNADVDGFDDTADNVGSIRMAVVATNVNTTDGLATGFTASIS